MKIRVLGLILALLVGLLGAVGTGLGTTATAAACARDYSHKVTDLGPKYLANAKGTLKIQWCVSRRGNIYGIYGHFDADTTWRGDLQGYEVVSDFGPSRNMDGDAINRNPYTKEYRVYVGYKIRACPLGWCSPKTSYSWRFTLYNSGNLGQVYLGGY